MGGRTPCAELARLGPLLGGAACSVNFRRTRVFIAASSGSVPSLHQEVTEHFTKIAEGSPPLISTAQMVQMLFEVGVVNTDATDVGEVMNKLMVHGFFKQTHPSKRDSYG